MSASAKTCKPCVTRCRFPILGVKTFLPVTFRALGRPEESRSPEAGAIALVKSAADVFSVELAQRLRTHENTLVAPGSHLRIEGDLHIWLGRSEDFLREGLRRVGNEVVRLNQEGAHLA
jgi:hypothetical protein